jgi:hypothetical protein
MPEKGRGAVTAVRSAPSAARPSSEGRVPEGRVPRRVPVPRWLDLRLALGLLLVLGSVLIGARVVSSAHATVPVWAAAGDLAAGTVLTSQDAVAVQVRLDSAAGAYVATGVPLGGRVLDRPVRKGELLPRSALQPSSPLVQLALPVQAGYVPPGLARGQLVDVYAMAGSSGSAAAGPAAGSVALVVSAAPVQDLSSRAAGVLSTPTTTVQVVVSVPADRAAQVLGTIGGRPLAVVVHQSVATPSTAGIPPVTGSPSTAAGIPPVTGSPSTAAGIPSATGSSSTPTAASATPAG